MAEKFAAAAAVERAGVDVPALLTLLIDSAAGELSTFYQISILRRGLSGPHRERLQARLDGTGAQDRGHFEALVTRIHELGDALPDDMEAGHHLPAFPAAATADARGLHEALVKAKKSAVRGYTRICDMTFGRDPRTYNLALAILHEEIAHEAWLSELLQAAESAPAATSY